MVDCSLPGTPRSQPLHAEHRHRPAGRAVTVHQAQEGETPWVRASRVPPGPKGVIVGRHFCAELFRSRGHERMNDRMPQGTPTVIALWLGHVAQSGTPLSHPPVVHAP